MARILSEGVKLPISYLNGVQKAINDGKWRAKQEPLKWLQKVGQMGALNLLGVNDIAENRQRVYVGRAVSPEQKRALTREESLRFDRPARIPKTFVGRVADLRLPAGIGSGLGEPNGRYCQPDPEQSTAAAIHDRAIDHFIYRAQQQGGYDHEELDTAERHVPERYLFPSSDDDIRRRVNWSAVFKDAGRDPSKLIVQEELNYLKLQMKGLSRDSILARQQNPVKRKSMQAAGKRLQRYWPEIERLLRGESKPQRVPECSTPQSPRAAHEVLRALAAKKRSCGPLRPSVAQRFDGSGLVI